jgi:carboxylate-amine ligase
MPIVQSQYIEENKWWALLHGLDASIYDFSRQVRLPMRDAIRDLLDFVREQAEMFGSQREMQHLHQLLDSPEGTGADRQIAVYQATGDTTSVIQFLREQTLAGISLSRTSV